MSSVSFTYEERLRAAKRLTDIRLQRLVDVGLSEDGLRLAQQECLMLSDLEQLELAQEVLANRRRLHYRVKDAT